MSDEKIFQEIKGVFSLIEMSKNNYKSKDSGQGLKTG